MTLTLIQGQLHDKLKASVSIFSEISLSIWVKFNMLPQPGCLLKFVPDLFVQVIFKGESSTDVILQDIRLTLSCVWTIVNRFVSSLL